MGAKREESMLQGVIRHRETEEYYAGSGEWTTEPAKAMHFKDLSWVVAEAVKYGIKDCCEFLVTFPGRSEFMISLPL